MRADKHKKVVHTPPHPLHICSTPAPLFSSPHRSGENADMTRIGENPDFKSKKNKANECFDKQKIRHKPLIIN